MFRPELIVKGKPSLFDKVYDCNLNVVECHEGVSAPKDFPYGPDVRLGFITATDAKTLLIFPCIMEKGDTYGVLRADALKLARQFIKKATGPLHIQLGRKRIRIGKTGVILPRRTECRGEPKYPDTSHVIPRRDMNPPEAVKSIGFSPKRLTALMNAMGCHEGLQFWFTGQYGQVLINPPNDGSVLGIIMPQRL